MFEAGKRYNRKDIEGIYTFVEQHSSDIDAGWFKSSSGKWCFLMYSCFDPMPIDDTPAPRMVTTCDIGARVVRGRDWAYGTDASQGGENAIGTITENATGDNCWVLWDNGIRHVYRIGEYRRFFDLYYADEQPKKEVELQEAELQEAICKECGCGKPYEPSESECKECLDIQKEEQAKIDKENGDDKTPPDPLPGIASIMFGSKPRLMYGSLMQIQGPTKDEQDRNARTEEERKRYEGR